MCLLWGKWCIVDRVGTLAKAPEAVIPSSVYEEMAYNDPENELTKVV